MFTILCMYAWTQCVPLSTLAYHPRNQQLGSNQDLYAMQSLFQINNLTTEYTQLCLSLIENSQ